MGKINPEAQLECFHRVSRPDVLMSFKLGSLTFEQRGRGTGVGTSSP
jgi:hypothetical protein